MNFSCLKLACSYTLVFLIFYFAFLGGPHRQSEFDVKIQRLIDMGVEEHKARVALSTYNWDLERATEQLFS